MVIQDTSGRDAQPSSNTITNTQMFTSSNCRTRHEKTTLAEPVRGAGRPTVLKRGTGTVLYRCTRENCSEGLTLSKTTTRRSRVLGRRQERVSRGRRGLRCRKTLVGTSPRSILRQDRNHEGIRKGSRIHFLSSMGYVTKPKRHRYDGSRTKGRGIYRPRSIANISSGNNLGNILRQVRSGLSLPHASSRRGSPSAM